MPQAVSYTHLDVYKRQIEDCGYFVNGHMADISMRAKLRGLKNANGDPLFKQDLQGTTQYALDGSPMNFPNNGAFDKSKALMISGDFSQLVYSLSLIHI